MSDNIGNIPADWPMCDCDGATCCAGRGPAVYSVLRGGKRLNLCTRCILPGDAERTTLPGVKNLDFDALMRFDSLGTMCILFDA